MSAIPWAASFRSRRRRRWRPATRGAFPGGRCHASPRPALARGVVRHVGDPVVCIIAESPEAAMAAGDAVDISWEPLPCVTASAAALQPDAPLLWPEAPGNSAFLFRKGEPAAVAAAFASA